jgi:hypothetical protein
VKGPAVAIAKSATGHLQPSCAVPSDGGLSPDSFRARRMLLTAEAGHKRTNQKSLSLQHRGDVCDDAGEPKQNMDANDGKKDRRSGGYREPAMLVIHCSSPASSTSTTSVENIQHRAIRCPLARASGHRPRQQALKFLQVVEFGPNVFKVMRGNHADLTT